MIIVYKTRLEVFCHSRRLKLLALHTNSVPSNSGLINFNFFCYVIVLLLVENSLFINNSINVCDEISYDFSIYKCGNEMLNAIQPSDTFV